MSLFHTLASIRSRGSRTSKAANLGGLHAKRKEHLSQFFTPEWVVTFAYASINHAFEADKRYRLLDNSCGSGVWFSQAKPEQHELVGFDIDAELITQVQSVLDGSGFTTDIKAGDLAEAMPPQCSVAFINPPFSIQLESPHLKQYKGVTHFGRFGADTSATSHEYALAQALGCADIVCAVVPASVTAKLDEMPIATGRLRAVYSLPSNTFASENVKAVQTDLLIFGEYQYRSGIEVIQATIDEQSQAQPLEGLHCTSTKGLRRHHLQFASLDTRLPAITLKATDDKRVKLTRKGRHIKLRFFDGVTQGHVLNALYQKRLHSSREHRYPQRLQYRGQLRLSLDVLMLQDNPHAAFEGLLNDIRHAGGIPQVQTELTAAIDVLAKEHAYMSTPFSHTVFVEGQATFTALATKTALLNRQQVGAVVKLNEKVNVERLAVGYKVTTERGEFDVEHEHFHSIFNAAEASDSDTGEWVEVHQPIKTRFPEQIRQIEARMQQVCTAKHLSWDFQFQDAVELAFKPKGAIAALEMALGKTRVATTLGLYFNGASLYVLRSRLVAEIKLELAELGVPDDLIHTIETPSDTVNLGKLNLISYETLRSPIHRRFPKITYAKRLKGKVKTLLADEGGIVSNQDTAQSKALRQVGAHRHYLFDGTPSPNYPREFLPLLCTVAGESKSYMPYSIDGPHIQAQHWTDASRCKVGRQAFMDNFATFQWVTNQFIVEENGAKREVPKVPAHNLPAFRQLLGGMVKRRTQQEPDVKRCVTFPVPVLEAPTIVPWEHDHLVTYYTVCHDFANWYRRYKADQTKNGKNLSLVIILAKLEACFKAANVPCNLDMPGVVSGFNHYTTKEIAVTERLVEMVNNGDTPIMFCRSPDTVERIHQLAKESGVNLLRFSGNESIDERNRILKEEVRGGGVQGLLATLGVSSDGLNLPLFNRFVFYNRSYKYREEYQAMFRLLRAANKREVRGEFFHLEGSIDEYMAQLLDWKATSFKSSLDYGQANEDEFHHFDAMLARFLESIPDIKAELQNAA